ncbi:MAG: Sec-independent protein translocase protein TatB [Gammaproteobacteria bacterium]
MFDMGFWEVVLIFVILLIVVGPERLPKLARTVGLWVGKARTMVSSVRSEIEQELRVEELKQSLHKQVDTEDFKALSSEVKSLSSDVKSVKSDVQRSIDKDTSKVAEALSTPKITTPATAGTGSLTPKSTTSQTPPDDVQAAPPVKQAGSTTGVE